MKNKDLSISSFNTHGVIFSHTGDNALLAPFSLTFVQLQDDSLPEIKEMPASLRRAALEIFELLQNLPSRVTNHITPDIGTRLGCQL